MARSDRSQKTRALAASGLTAALMGSGLIISAMPASAGVSALGGNTVTCYANGASFTQQAGQDSGSGTVPVSRSRSRQKPL